MHHSVAKLILALALAGAAAPHAARADAGDDQYAVASGHYARNRWKLAVEEFQVFLRDFPEHSKNNLARFFQAEAYVQLGEFPAAQKLFGEFLQRDPTNRFARQALFRQGECAYILGDNAGAREVLAEFLTTYRDDKLNAFVLPYLGEIALARDDFAEAKKYFEQALEKFPDGQLQDDCRFGLARIMEEQGDGESAARVYLALAAKAGSPLADDAQFRLGAVQYARGDYEEALRTLGEFDSTYKQSDLVDKARLSRGWSLFQLDRFDEARELFESLKEKPGVASEARYWLGLTYKAKQQWAEAAKILLAAADDRKHELAPAMLFHAGDALRRQQKTAEAGEAFEAVLSGWPEGEWADDALLGRLQLALAANNSQQVDALAADFARRFPESSLSAEVDRAKAESLLKRKQFAEAAGVLEPLLEASDPAAETAAVVRYLLALAYQGQKKNEQALEVLRPLSEAKQGELLADARLTQAALLIDSSRFAEAIAPLEAYLKAASQEKTVDPTDKAVSKCLAQLVVCYGRTKDFERAREHYAELLRRMPDDELFAATSQHLAEAAYAAGDYAWSTELFASLGKRSLTAAAAAKGLSGLAWSQFKLDQTEQAAKTFDRLVQSHSENPLAAEAALMRGQIFEEAEQPEAALAMYRWVIGKHPQAEQVAPALLAAARIHDKLEQDNEAAELYQRLAKDFADQPFSDAVLYEWAWVARDLNQSEESDRLFAELRKKHPDSRFRADATYRLAERAHAAKDYERAKSLLAELAADQPDQGMLPHVLFLRGQVAAGLSDWQQVAQSMAKLVEVAPEHAMRPLAEYWIAEAGYRQGDYTEAGKRLDALASRLEGRQEAWTAMVPLRQAQVLAQQKKWKEAQDLAESIGGRFPDFDQQFEADYVIGRALASRGEFEAARAAYQKVIRSTTGGKTETAAMAQWMIGETFFHQKNYEAALREYLRLEILYAYPTWQAAALLQAGKCHETLGQWRQAAEVYERLVEQYAQTSFAEEAARRLKSAKEQLARPS